MAVSLPLCDSEVNMRGWQQGRNGVTMVYESFFLIAMVFESLTLISIKSILLIKIIS
jgi:hypothetical protein